MPESHSSLKPLLIGVGLTSLTLSAATLISAWIGSTILLRRRTPDPADLPSNYGLEYSTVNFPARDGTPLHGWWIAPPRPNGQTVVLVHGHQGSMDGDTGQAAALAQAGFRVLLFNLRAHGASGGRHVTFGAREDQDVLGALDWLAAQHITQVGLVGFSMGAGVALIAAAQDKHVAAVVADGPIRRVQDGLTGLGRAIGLPREVIQPWAELVLWLASRRAGIDLRRGDPARWVSRVTCPVLFIHGARDPFTTMRDAGALVAATRQGRLWVLPEAGHRDAYTLDPDTYYDRVTAFLTQHLDAATLRLD